MRNRGKRSLFIILTLLALAGLGLAVAASSRRQAPPPRGASTKGAPLDCQALEKRLRACAVQVVAATDASAQDGLRKMTPALRKAVVKTITDELIGRVVAPCQQRRGRLVGAAPIATCLARAPGTDPASCTAFATCLETAFAKLPATPPPKTK